MVDSRLAAEPGGDAEGPGERCPPSAEPSDRRHLQVVPVELLSTALKPRFPATGTGGS